MTAIFDADVHPLRVREHQQRGLGPLSYLPERWQRHAREAGVARGGFSGGERAQPREYGHRWDTETPSGGPPGSDPAFAAEQLLDTYGIDAAILNDIGAFGSSGLKHQPAGFSAAYCRALNEHRRDHWLAADSRWYSSISLSYELPGPAVEEIDACKTMDGYGDRFRQVLFAPDNLRPPGHPSYWPIYEACEHYGLPVAFHVFTGNRLSPSGSPDYFFEHHNDYLALNFPIVASFVFEGVFDRFPGLQVAMIELGWAWALPLADRLDGAYRALGAAHLEKKPSEYVRDHFWFGTQPGEEPEDAAGLAELVDELYDAGMGAHLMYASDYPHWDFDPPSALPPSLSPERRAAVLGGNARRLYGL